MPDFFVFYVSVVLLEAAMPFKSQSLDLKNGHPHAGRILVGLRTYNEYSSGSSDYWWNWGISVLPPSLYLSCAAFTLSHASSY